MSILEEKLRQKNLKITPQRLEVLRALNKVPSHPSVESIYRAVKRRYPAVSLATVYKTLDTLVEIGEIRVALVHNGKALYDTRVDHHHHFICDHCGHVEDVEVKNNCIGNCTPYSMRKSYDVLRSELIFFGQCQSCKDSGKEPKAISSAIH